MSQGLGKVEKMILKALKRYGDCDIGELCVLRVHGLDFYAKLCADESDIFEWEVPTSKTSIWQSTARAIRTLARKGLVNCTRCSDESGEDGRRKSAKVAIC
jgi:hypothetical protein